MEEITEENNSTKQLTYLSKKPDVRTLRGAYEQTVSDLSSFFDMCRSSYDDRRNFWAGKSNDLRKHGADAFPWEGASDMESHVIDERIGRLVSLFISTLSRANIKAFPSSMAHLGRAKMISSFMKWMASSGYIPRFKREMELGANYLLERGILITYVGWHREDRRFIQKLNISQIAGRTPEAMEMFRSGYADEEVMQTLMLAFEGLTEKKARQAISDLRETGEAEFPVIRRQVDSPEVKTLAPDGDFLFPTYVTDPQRAPYCFWRTFYTPQELENKVMTDGWNEDFVDYVIDHYKGVRASSIEHDSSAISYNNGVISDSFTNAEDLIEIVHGYQRLIDEDGAEGIYETIFHKDLDDDSIVTPYAKFELMNGYDDYPVVVTKLSEDSKRLYDVNSLPALLRGIQNQVKIERDSRIDRNSWATLPPLMHPKGQAPLEYGPGRFIPYRRKGDIEFAPSPPAPSGSIEIETTLEEQANRLCGLDESQISQNRLQFFVDKFLSHSAEVLKLAFKCFQRFGPDELFFKIYGESNPQVLQKGDPSEDYDIIISYDVLNNDPETQEKKLQQLLQLSQMDRNGRLSIDQLLEVSANAIDPIMADSIIKPQEDAQKDIREEITNDLSKIYAGIEVPARPNGAQVALQAIQQYAQQPDVGQRLQSDEAFKARLEKYAQQYNFQIQQQQNAEIGKIGTNPAQMGEMNTQTMNQK
jgi:hypothetical protein